MDIEETNTDLQIQDHFYISLATIVAPSVFKDEVEKSKIIILGLQNIYPNIDSNVWFYYILESYKYCPNPISVKKRLEYIDIILFSEMFSMEFEDPEIEKQKRVIEYRILCGHKPSKNAKMAITQIVNYQYFEFVAMRSEYLASIEPTYILN